MGILDSVLAEIGDVVTPATSRRTASPADVPAKPAPASKPRVVSTVAAPVTKTGDKRKADQNLNSSTGKLPRHDRNERTATNGQATSSLNPPTNRTTASRAEQSTPSSKPPSNASAAKTDKSALPSNGTPTSTTKRPARKALPKASELAPAPTGPPKKGSYAEIIARGKAAQAAAAAKSLPVGKLFQHKKVEKREYRAQRVDLKKRRRATSTSPRGSRSRSRSRGSSAEATLNKPKRKPTELAYKGTMRPSKKESTYKPTYKGTMNLNPAAQTHKAPVPARSTNYASKQMASRDYFSDEEEDYLSDASSDMEAGVFDLDRENEISLRAAKHEDAEAAREEDEYKRQKERRKSSLAKLASEASKKKRLY